MIIIFKFLKIKKLKKNTFTQGTPLKLLRHVPRVLKWSSIPFLGLYHNARKIWVLPPDHPVIQIIV